MERKNRGHVDKGEPDVYGLVVTRTDKLKPLQIRCPVLCVKEVY